MRLNPDVIVMDISMPNLNGLDATREIRQILPRTDVLVLSQHDSPEMMRQALNAGARGYVVKSAISADLITGIDSVRRGQLFFDPAATGSSASNIDVQEILQRSEAFEAALRESEERFRLTFEHAAVGVAHISEDGHFLRVNRKLCEIAGYTAEELGKLTFQDITHSDDRASDVAQAAKLAGGQVDQYSIEKRCIRKDGAVVWVNSTKSAVRDWQRRLKYFIAVIEDVTTRRSAEDDLRESEARFRLAQAAAQIGAWEWDPENDTRSLSPELHRIFGSDADDFTRADVWASRVHADDWQNVSRIMEESQISGEMDFEYRYNHPKRGLRWLYCKGRRMRHESRMFGVVLDITERKHTQEAISDSEQRLRAIVETTPECVKLVAPDGTLLHMNAAGLKMIEADSVEAIIGQSVYNLVAPEDRQRFREFNEKICSGQKGALEFDVIGLRGARRHMATYAAPLLQPDGQNIQLAITRDITERRFAHRAAALLAAIVDSSDDAIVSKDLDGTITSWNQGAERMFGYTAGEAIGRNIILIIPSDRLDEEADILARIRQGDRVDHFETVRKRKDGALLDISVTVSPVKDSAGRVTGASKVAREITGQKRAEERERRITAEAVAATAKFRAVFEQTTQFAGVMSNDGILIEANNMCLEACGYRAEEVVGRFFWETSWWRNFPESQRKIRAATPEVAQGIPYREVLNYSLADGAERIVDFALYPIRDDEGRVLFLHPTGVDITDRIRTEESYRKLTQTLDAEVRARTQEIEERNAEVLRQNEQLRELSWRLLRTQDEERRHIARELHDSAGQILTVLGMNIATLVRKAGKKAPELAKDAQEIRELIQLLHKEIRTASYLLHPPMLDESGLALALNWYVDGLVKRSGMDITLNISQEFGRLPNDLELAIFRLVQECLTNIHRHSGSKTAAIGITREEGTILVDVQDQGRGMSPEKLAEIQSHGSGVGIRGMRERIRQLQGKIQIDSSSSGTRVVAVIPIGKPLSQPERSSLNLQSAPN